MAEPARIAKTLPWLLVAYCFASFAHFAHNAEFLQEYPNLPGWFTRGGVYGAWLAQLPIGVLGCLLYRHGRQLPAFLAMAIYASFGFDGLLHYTRAPFAEHTTAMNLTIWAEVVAAAALFVLATWLAVDRALKPLRIVHPRRSR